MDTARWQEMHISGYNGADEDEIMDNIFSKFSKEGLTLSGAGTGIWKMPKNSGPQWAADIIRRFHVMKEDKVSVPPDQQRLIFKHFLHV